MIVTSEQSSDLPTHITGTPELQLDIKALLIEYSDIFRKDVSPKPADVPSMDVKVDKSKWNTLKGNMGVSPRIQSQKQIVNSNDKSRKCSIWESSRDLMPIGIHKYY